jgi:hypothetical protein
VAKMNLRDFIDDAGLFRPGTRLFCVETSWRITNTQPMVLENEDSGEVMTLGAISSIPAEGWSFTDPHPV